MGRQQVGSTTLLGLVAALAIAGAGPALAQPPGEAGTRTMQSPGAVVQLPAWDVGGGASLIWAQHSEIAGTGDGQTDDRVTGNAEFRADVGRYLTPHLKVGAAVTSGPRFDSFETESVIVGGTPRPFGINVKSRVTSVSPTLTYQFLHNAFMHPYVAGGVRVNVLQLERHRLPFYGIAQPALPPIEERHTLLLARPFAAFGFKSYLNRQAFVRTELMTAAGPRGLAQLTLHVGIGVDF